MTKTEDNKLRSTALPLNRRVRTVGPSRDGAYVQIVRYVQGEARDLFIGVEPTGYSETEANR